MAQLDRAASFACLKRPKVRPITAQSEGLGGGSVEDSRAVGPTHFRCRQCAGLSALQVLSHSEPSPSDWAVMGRA
jgi:hypothetical protein